MNTGKALMVVGQKRFVQTMRKAGADLSPQAQEFCDFALAWVADHRADLFQWPGA